MSPRRSEAHLMDDTRPFLLVICGPPCSGKSVLWRALKAARPDIHCYEMDDVRMEILPGPLHDKSRRSAAYRVMQFRAAQHLHRGQSVAVCATYVPSEHRAEVASLTLRLGIRLFVVH